MKRNFCLILCLAATAFFLVSCGDQSVLLLDGETAANERLTEEESVCGEPDECTGSLSTIVVYLCGRVKRPGVYEVPKGSRVYELVELAGGFTEDAATEYLTLAQTVSDGQTLVIPSLDEAGSDRYGAGGDTESGGLININTADRELLMTLPGIGEAKASAIIAWREEHGPFGKPEDIMQVSGIKEAAFEKIKQWITTE